MNLKPITFKQANAFVREHHRHNGVVQGCKFVVGVESDGELVGVAIAARPVARLLDDGWTLEVRRVCTTGVKNVCSMLYRACVRAGQAMGYKKVISYTLETESGSSLKASGFVDCGLCGGGTWNRPNRKREDKHLICKKRLWAALFLSALISTPCSASVFPVQGAIQMTVEPKAKAKPDGEQGVQISRLGPTSVVTPEFVQWVGMKESGMNHRAVGRHGEQGAWQIKPIALKDVNKNFGWRYTVSDLRDPSPARAVATAFLGLQERRLLGYLRRQPSTSEIYSAYRYGFAGWKRRVAQ